MAVTIFTGLNPNTTEPLDSRMVKADEAARLGINSNIAYEGLIVYQEDNEKVYILTDKDNISSNSGWDELGESATDYTLPIADNSTLGGVKVAPSSEIDIDADGFLTLGPISINGNEITSGTISDQRLPVASATAAGILSTTQQSIDGRKIFVDGIEVDGDLDVVKTGNTRVDIDFGITQEIGGPGTYSALKSFYESVEVGGIDFNINGSADRVNADAYTSIALKAKQKGSSNINTVLEVSTERIDADALLNLESKTTYPSSDNSTDGDLFYNNSSGTKGLAVRVDSEWFTMPHDIPQAPAVGGADRQYNLEVQSDGTIRWTLDGGAAGTEITVEDSNVEAGTASRLNFTGDGVTATVLGNEATITIDGASDYSLPAATTSNLGGVIVPSSGNITVDSSGEISIANLPAGIITSGQFGRERIAFGTPSNNQVIFYDGSNDRLAYGPRNTFSSAAGDVASWAAGNSSEEIPYTKLPAGDDQNEVPVWVGEDATLGDFVQATTGGIRTRTAAQVVAGIGLGAIPAADSEAKEYNMQVATNGVVSWVEDTGGGGGGDGSGGHTIQSNGTDQTQRTNLNFSADFAITDSLAFDRTTISLTNPTSIASSLSDLLEISSGAIGAKDLGADAVWGWDDSAGKATFLAGSDVRLAIGAPGLGSTNTFSTTNTFNDGLVIPTHAANPSITTEGAIFWDTNDDELRVYNGSSWTNISGGGGSGSSVIGWGPLVTGDLTVEGTSADTTEGEVFYSSSNGRFIIPHGDTNVLDEDLLDALVAGSVIGVYRKVGGSDTNTGNRIGYYKIESTSSTASTVTINIDDSTTVEPPLVPVDGYTPGDVLSDLVEGSDEFVFYATPDITNEDIEGFDVTADHTFTGSVVFDRASGKQKLEIHDGYTLIGDGDGVVKNVVESTHIQDTGSKTHTSYHLISETDDLTIQKTGETDNTIQISDTAYRRLSIHETATAEDASFDLDYGAWAGAYEWSVPSTIDLTNETTGDTRAWIGNYPETVDTYTVSAFIDDDLQGMFTDGTLGVIRNGGVNNDEVVFAATDSGDIQLFAPGANAANFRTYSGRTNSSIISQFAFYGHNQGSDNNVDTSTFVPYGSIQGWIEANDSTQDGSIRFFAADAGTLDEKLRVDHDRVKMWDKLTLDFQSTDPSNAEGAMFYNSDSDTYRINEGGNGWEDIATRDFVNNGFIEHVTYLSVRSTQQDVNPPTFEYTFDAEGDIAGSHGIGTFWYRAATYQGKAAYELVFSGGESPDANGAHYIQIVRASDNEIGYYKVIGYPQFSNEGNTNDFVAIEETPVVGTDVLDLGSDDDDYPDDNAAFQINWGASDAVTSYTVFNDNFDGLVPHPGTTAGFLRDDGTWVEAARLGVANDFTATQTFSGAIGAIITTDGNQPRLDFVADDDGDNNAGVTELGDIQFYLGSTNVSSRRGIIRMGWDNTGTQSDFEVFLHDGTNLYSALMLDENGLSQGTSSSIDGDDFDKLADLPDLPTGDGTTQKKVLQTTGASGSEVYTWVDETEGDNITVTSSSVTDGTNTFDKYTDANAVSATIGKTDITDANKTTYRSNLGAGEPIVWNDGSNDQTITSIVAGTNITLSESSGALTITSSGGGGGSDFDGELESATPTFTAKDTSTAPASDPDGGTDIGKVVFSGRNDNSTEEYADYATIQAKTLDTTDGSEDGEISIEVMKAGTSTEVAYIDEFGITASEADIYVEHANDIPLFEGNRSTVAANSVLARFSGYDGSSNDTQAGSFDITRNAGNDGYEADLVIDGTVQLRVDDTDTTVTGNLVVNGNVTLGDAGADSLTVNADTVDFNAARLQDIGTDTAPRDAMRAVDVRQTPGLFAAEFDFTDWYVQRVNSNDFRLASDTAPDSTVFRDNFPSNGTLRIIAEGGVVLDVDLSQGANFEWTGSDDGGNWRIEDTEFTAIYSLPTTGTDDVEAMFIYWDEDEVVQDNNIVDKIRGLGTATTDNFVLSRTSSGLEWVSNSGGGGSGSDVPNHPNVDSDTTSQFVLQVADSGGTETETWEEIGSVATTYTETLSVGTGTDLPNFNARGRANLIGSRVDVGAQNSDSDVNIHGIIQIGGTDSSARVTIDAPTTVSDSITTTGWEVKELYVASSGDNTAAQTAYNIEICEGRIADTDVSYEYYESGDSSLPGYKADALKLKAFNVTRGSNDHKLVTQYYYNGDGKLTHQYFWLTTRTTSTGTLAATSGASKIPAKAESSDAPANDNQGVAGTELGYTTDSNSALIAVKKLSYNASGKLTTLTINTPNWSS